MGLIDRALALNPSFARGWYRSGILRLFAGQPDPRRRLRLNSMPKRSRPRCSKASTSS
jgi:hypothetical protein